MSLASYTSRGKEIRVLSKQLVLEYMQASGRCASNADGIKQAEIFRDCGLDWGDYPNAESTKQQYWVVALLRELEREGKIQRDLDTKLWRLK